MQFCCDRGSEDNNMENYGKKAVIFDLTRYMIEDGPGIRTNVFFKGCPLRCMWCSNPFGLSPKPQIVYNQRKCKQCGACVETCPEEACSLIDNHVITDREKCTACGQCTDACLYEARKVTGKLYYPSEIVDEISRDMMFYRRDSGGVTLSGGEPLMQWGAAEEILVLCRERMIDRAMETSAFASWDHFKRLALLCNHVFVDIKHIDSNIHESLTGVPNELILANIKKLAEYTASHNKPSMVLRIPVIPGLNNDEKTMTTTANFISALPGIIAVNLIPYHNLGSNKYEMIDMTYQLASLERTQREVLEQYKHTINVYAPDCSCTIGGSEVEYF